MQVTMGAMLEAIGESALKVRELEKEITGLRRVIVDQRAKLEKYETLDENVEAVADASDEGQVTQEG